MLEALKNDMDTLCGLGAATVSVQHKIPLVVPSSTSDEEHYQSISACAETCFKKFSDGLTMFQRGGVAVEIVTEADPDEGIITVFRGIKREHFRSRIEKYFLPMAWKVSGKNADFALKAVTISNDMAEALLATSEAQKLLPTISGLAKTSVILADGRILPAGYDRQSGWFVTGRGTLEVPLETAVATLSTLLDGFDFLTPGDRSRAIADWFTPALRFGRFLPRVPAGVAEADVSQSGKTYRQYAVAAAYGDTPAIFTKRNGGVGSLDESFAQKLFEGRQFILLDNVRGALESQNIEAFMTAQGRTFGARVPHHGEVELCPMNHVLMVSSNGVETTPDFANRSCIVRIRKQPATYQYPKYDGLSLLEYIQRNQPFVLGCIYSVLKKWIADGRPQLPMTSDREHDFREWCGAMDWIVQNLFHAAPLMEGHRAAQVRTSNPALSFVRAVALAVEKAGKLGQSLSATNIYELCEDAAIEIPKVRDGDEHGGKIIIAKMMRRAGCCDGAKIEVEGVTVASGKRDERRNDGNGYISITVYTFSRTTPNHTKGI